MRVGAEVEWRCEAGRLGYMRGAGATRDDGEGVYFGTGPVVVEGVCEGGIFVANEFCGVGEVVVCTVIPFPYLNIFNRGVAAASIRVSNECRF
jgi:hypothetical protein